MKKNIIEYYNYANTIIPIKLSLEWRRNVRVAIGRKEVHLRLPAISSKKFIAQQMEWSKHWLSEQLERNPELLHRFMIKPYKTGDQIKINDLTYTIFIHTEKRKTLSARITEHELIIKVPEQYSTAELNSSIKNLLSRTFSSHFKNQVKQRIHELNELYFGEKLGDIRIKYNKSNWGSCSAKRNLNISSRLLFAPKAVQDYVFIHELTHLKELNHSPRFWNIIADIVPDYKSKEKWLKKNSHLCDF